MKYFTIAVLLVMATALGCKDDGEKVKEKAKGETPASAQKAQKAPPSPDGEVVVAKIGDHAITMGEVMRSMDLTNPRLKALYMSSPGKMTTYITNYVNQEMLYKQAIKENIGQREDLKANVEQYKKRLLIRTLTQSAIPTQIGQEDLQAYYDENKDDMVEVKARQLLVRANPAKNVTMEGAKALANKIKQRADRGEDFQKIAADVLKDDVSRQMGGRVTSIRKGRFAPEIDEMIFSLSEGEISDPIELPNGYMVIKIEKAAAPVPLQSVASMIQSELRKNALNNYMATLKEQMNVEIYEDALKEKAPQ